jgi:hypothetical protein
MNTSKYLYTCDENEKAKKEFREKFEKEITIRRLREQVKELEHMLDSARGVIKFLESENAYFRNRIDNAK